MERIKTTVPRVQSSKDSGTPLAMITAYDAPFAAIVDEAGVDMILVGDSVGTVMQGQRTTIPVSMEEMEYHVRMVASVRPKALIVGDMPFGSYQADSADAVRNAVRLMKAGAECVKLEGGVNVAERIAAITRADIPVMGHIGLTPQSVNAFGGFKVQGKTPRDAVHLIGDAKALEIGRAHV